jgi:DnaJ-class molecular chaperone
MFGKCFSCNGTGQTAPVRPPVPGAGAPQQGQLCTSCKGAGTSNFTCSFCKGTGKNGSFKCSFCDGKMFSKCYSCNGAGRRP